MILKYKGEIQLNLTIYETREFLNSREYHEWYQDNNQIYLTGRRKYIQYRPSYYIGKYNHQGRDYYFDEVVFDFRYPSPTFLNNK